ncbi:MAG: transcriptional regulator [Dermatophilaceae bacterium]
MPAATSDPTTLALHAVPLLGFADTSRVASRFGLDRAQTEENLLDFEAFGWVRRSGFAGTSGWSLTDSGKAENQRRLTDELEEVGAREVVADVHDRFLPLNAHFLTAVTRWQTRPLPGNAMAPNDHTDFRWDERVIETLTSMGRRVGALNTELVGVLERFDGYTGRYDAALTRVIRGEHHWADGIAVESCHLVWMQLHEDLIATLGVSRSDHS